MEKKNKRRLFDLLFSLFSKNGFQGSSKSGFLGEASIDFADFLTEAEPLTVSLPLKFANSGAVLNVTSLLFSFLFKVLRRFQDVCVLVGADNN